LALWKTGTVETIGDLSGSVRVALDCFYNRGLDRKGEGCRADLCLSASAAP
jgi:hypothetical protein